MKQSTLRCWWCSAPLRIRRGQLVYSAMRDHDGNPVKVHNGCAYLVNDDTRVITAQPSMSPGPRCPQ